VWGSNWRGEMGNGTIAYQATPLVVSTLTTTAAHVGSGGVCMLVSTRDDDVYWWGTNLDPALTVSTEPVQGLSGAETTGTGIIAGGGGFSAVIRSDGVWTFGDNYVNGRLGYDTTGSNIGKPGQALAGAAAAAAVSAGDNHMLALVGNQVFAWGANDKGQLGGGSLTVPVPVANVVAIAAGGDHALALDGNAEVWHWGWGNSTPAKVPDPSGAATLTGVTAIAVGPNHCLAVSGGAVYAWGGNFAGQLGDGTKNDSNNPVQVVGLSGVTIIAVAAGSAHSLALDDKGNVWAWGANWSGRLGDGTFADHATPVKVNGLTGVTAIAAGRDHSLALSGGTVYAWGWNGYGQLGNSSRYDSNVPVAVSGLSGVVAIAAGDRHSLAVKNDATTWGWGAAEFGQLGNGSSAYQLSPAKLK